MAQSPETATPDTSEADRYLLGWKALSQLIGEGRSFSGNEKNNAFLNTKDGQFADISASSGLDFADDGRAVAVCDWNLDGRQDVWVTNRTAPRVRLLLNRGTGGGWVALRLRGTDCNRDAIGARVVIELPDGSKRQKSVRAGDGFLAQSSKWVHFGLGSAPSIASVTIHWPGGSAESISGVEPGKFLTVTQGEGKAQPWSTPVGDGNFAPEPMPLVLPDPPGETRTWLIGRLPFPESELVRSNGKPLLVNLWSRSCRPCLEELAEWTAHAGEIDAVGLDILALSVDAIGGDQVPTVPPEGFPFRSANADDSVVEAMELFHRTFVELQQPLPVPTSFLLDAGGRVAAIYKGRVELKQLLEDVKMLDRPDTEQRDAAVPFPGRWASNLFPPQPVRLAEAFATAGKPGRRHAYLEQYLQSPSQAPADVVAKVQIHLGRLLLQDRELEQAAEVYAGLFESAPDRPPLHREAGIKLLQNNLAAAALKHFRVAAPAYQKDPSFHFNLGLAEMATRDPTAAIASFRTVLSLTPNDAAAHFQLGNLSHATKRGRDAVKHYRKALEIQPGWAFPANNLAWLLATHPDDELRDGAEAVRLAQALVEADGGRNPSTLSTLAAAQAEAGKFSQAVETASAALELAKHPSQQGLARQLQSALDLYRNSTPLRTP